MVSNLSKSESMPGCDDSGTGVAGACFHCGLALSPDLDFRLAIDGAERAMCCHGCLAVAQAIIAAGHENFYRVRTETAPTGRELIPDFIRESEIYDTAEIQRQYVHRLDAEICEASLILEGITCAACIWLIEQYLAGLRGVEQVRVNYATQRALVRWDDSRIRLSEILHSIRKIGYRAVPYDPNRQQELHRRQRGQQLRRLAVAGLFGMQVMMLSISLYAGAWSGMEQSFTFFFRWLSLGLTLPVMFYAAIPFFHSAWRDLAQRRVGMDVPVSIAILVAFASSCMATLTGDGEIYFDSIVMFVFFLSASRYFENMARQRCAGSVEKLVQSLPLTATRLQANGDREATVAAATLAIGDRVLIRPGETVPADGTLVSGFSALDESLLNGESNPLDKQPGDRLLGGSINVTNPLQMEVGAVGADTVMAEIQRSIERAQADKPPLALLADRVAARFISIVLLVVAGVAIFWWIEDAERWFDIALAVLIVSCPCALSLAMPTAISAMLGKMQACGLLVKRAAALEKLNHVTHVVFDKTGTLTLGKPVLSQVVSAAPYDSAECLGIAAAIEQHSAHPLARALVHAAGDIADRELSGVFSVAGGGLHARIDDVDYFIGNCEFITANSCAEIPGQWLESIDSDALSAVILACADEVMALFTFVDELREDAITTIESLCARGISVTLMSGDRAAATRQVALQTGIGNCRAGLTPQQKMEAVQDLQTAGAVVLMVGDGINDAPVLAGADVSIAAAGASSLARVNADIVLIADRLDGIDQVFHMADRTRRVIRQNMAWALFYNFGAIPVAAIGLVAPWLAAIGMSLSSLLVVINALRLTR
ncbi:MAG: heavy metal translocating P-type ATPase [Gammaproteobacteria bacterium]|nr:heavy metal translocating P-type ATPase [Gammaproteobacteria bacterium]